MTLMMNGGEEGRKGEKVVLTVVQNNDTLQIWPEGEVALSMSKTASLRTWD
jgi:hypothetical protein